MTGELFILVLMMEISNTGKKSISNDNRNRKINIKKMD